MSGFTRLWTFVTIGLVLIAAGQVWMLWNLGALVRPSWSWVRWTAPIGLFPLLCVLGTALTWRSARDSGALRPGGKVHSDLLVGGVVGAALPALWSALAALLSGIEYLSARHLSNAGGPLCDSSPMRFGDRCVDIAAARVHSYGELADQYWSAAGQANLAANYFWVSIAVALVSLTVLLVSFLKL
ncbi:hypothetical protein [Nocardia sp. NPDC056000]|uniref:hypothetical protein n=1 Tax=Nocardia sp. NPDC056000 TaxID=3345674 RepID=UPI0035D695EA